MSFRDVWGSLVVVELVWVCGVCGAPCPRHILAGVFVWVPGGLVRLSSSGKSMLFGYECKWFCVTRDLPRSCSVFLGIEMLFPLILCGSTERVVDAKALGCGVGFGFFECGFQGMDWMLGDFSKLGEVREEMLVGRVFIGGERNVTEGGEVLDVGSDLRLCWVL